MKRFMKLYKRSRNYFPFTSQMGPFCRAALVRTLMLVPQAVPWLESFRSQMIEQALEQYL